MSISAKMKQQFFKAADDALSDSALQQRPVVNIDMETFRQILAPIEGLLDGDPVFSQYETGVEHQIEELRRMCLEAQAAHTTKDTCTKQRRSELLNVLQGVLENIQETSNKDSQFVQVDFGDLFALSDLTDVIHEAGMTHGEFLNHHEASQALFSTAKNIDEAQKRLWLPALKMQEELALGAEFNSDQGASNDPIYEQHDVA